jgi:predicted house-cleaning noncanonical NTP pyrophosphatase (MazG superfamily)
LEAGTDPVAWATKMREDLALLTEKRHEGPDEFVKVFNLDTFDDDLARIERLDAMFDRTIKRLMQVKTMKQMHARLEPKLIDLSATTNPPAQDGTENRLN